MKKRWITWMLLLCSPVLAFARGNIHIGSLQIHPSLSLQENFDDNVYATSSDTHSDWITLTKPGIKLEMPVNHRYLFGAEYRAAIYNYLEYTSENITDHFANAYGQFKFGRGTTFKLRDDYTNGHEDRSTSASGEINKYEKNAASADLAYVFVDRYKAEVAYTLTNWDFSRADNQYRNRTENLIATYFYYRFLPRTAAFVEYDFKTVDYELKTNGGLNNTVQTPFLGLKWDISEETKGTVKAGYLYKNFNDSENGSIGDFTASVELDQAFGARSLLRLIGLRDVNEADVQGTTYYTTTSAQAIYTHKLPYRLSAVLRGSYGENDYSNGVGGYADRHDEILTGGAGLKYQMRDWLDFALDYYHLDRNSNIPTSDLNENVASLSVNFSM